LLLSSRTGHGRIYNQLKPLVIERARGRISNQLHIPSAIRFKLFDGRLNSVLLEPPER
jgi:hypothetical protein